MTTIHRGTVLSFNAGTWTAMVLLEGSDMEAQIPVGQWLPPAMLAANAEVAVICFDPTNLDDGLVIGAYGALGAQNLATTDTPTFGALNIGAASGASAGQINTTGTNSDPINITVDGNQGGIVINTYRTGSNQSRLTANSARGTLATPAATASGDILLQLYAHGYQTATGAFDTAASFMQLIADEAFTATAQGTRIELRTKADGATAGTLGLTIGPGAKIGFLGAAAVTRPAGWTAATNTKTRTTFDTTTVTLPALAAHVAALIDELLSLGLIGA